MANEKIDAAIKMLQEGAEKTFESDGFKRFLDIQSRFPNYSLNNQLLILMQKPEAEMCMGYKAWQAVGRQVRKGERGITIIAPMPYKQRKEVETTDAYGNQTTEEREIDRLAFKTTTTFDISQTEGEPLPSLTQILCDPVEDFADLMEAIHSISPVPIAFEPIKGSANGFYSISEKRIVVKEDLPETQTVKTLLHEITHACLHASKDERQDRRLQEVQAESVAYVVCKNLGIDSDLYSIGYVTTWSSGKDLKELKASLQVIHDQSEKMIAGIQDKLQQIREQRQEMEQRREQRQERKHQRSRSMAM